MFVMVPTFNNILSGALYIGLSRGHARQGPSNKHSTRQTRNKRDIPGIIAPDFLFSHKERGGVRMLKMGFLACLAHYFGPRYHFVWKKPYSSPLNLALTAIKLWIDPFALRYRRVNGSIPESLKFPPFMLRYLSTNGGNFSGLPSLMAVTLALSQKEGETRGKT
jgi:hypothetical protein